MKKLIPSQYENIDVKVGDIIRIKKRHHQHIKYFGELHVVKWVPDNFVGKTRLHYPRVNDWIQVHSVKLAKEWTVHFNEFEKVNKSS
tara:strand:+ start:204 stop:464 length:261 start_codon:yes stop_codon:yes gene_type:complete